MSFEVATYNQDSGFKLGEILSKAATEAEAKAEAAKVYGVEGLTQFRFVCKEVADEVEAVADPFVTAEAEAAPAEEVPAAPVVEAEVSEVDKLVEVLKNVDKSVLGKAFAALNNAMGQLWTRFQS